VRHALSPLRIIVSKSKSKYNATAERAREFLAQALQTFIIAVEEESL
jgi:hypothetical protein